jgi:hypothetical protein
MEKPLNANWHKLSFEKNNAIFEEIKFDVLKNKIPQVHPQCVILGGPPASGKSTLADPLITDDAVWINIDELRQRHPSWDSLNMINDKYTAFYTNADAGIWYERLIRESVDNKFNVVIENTFGNKEVCLYLCDSLTMMGYHVHIKGMVVSYDKILLGSHKRYEINKAGTGYGRFVLPYSIDGAYKNFADTIIHLQKQEKVKSIELHSRSEPIFTGDYYSAQFSEIIYNERIKKYTIDDEYFIIDGWTDVVQLMKNRNASRREFSYLSDRLDFCIQLMSEEKYPEENIQIIRNFHQQCKKDLTLFE